jgi:hypothetical protein
MSLKDGFWDKVCSQFDDIEKYREFNIGYSHMTFPYILFPSISIALNLLIIVTYLRRAYKSNNKRVDQRGSMEKMLYYMSYLELILSLYWLINSLVFYNVRYCYVLIKVR